MLPDTLSEQFVLYLNEMHFIATQLIATWWKRQYMRQS